MDLAGRVMLAARSVGKHLFLRFDRDLSLHCHLGMDGSWRVRPAGGQRRHTANHQARAILATADQVAVGLNLKQMALLGTADEHRLVDHLGPDLLDHDWSASHVAEAVDRLRRDPSREIGVALLDQTALAGAVMQ